MAISGSRTVSFRLNSKGHHLLFSLLLVQSFFPATSTFFQFLTHLWTFSPCYLCFSPHDFFLNFFFLVLLFFCPFHHFTFSLLFFLFSPSFPYTFSILFCYTFFFASLLPSFQFFSLYFFTSSFQYLTSVISGHKLPGFGSRKLQENCLITLPLTHIKESKAENRPRMQNTKIFVLIDIFNLMHPHFPPLILLMCRHLSEAPLRKFFTSQVKHVHLQSRMQRTPWMVAELTMMSRPLSVISTMVPDPPSASSNLYKAHATVAAKLKPSVS